MTVRMGVSVGRLPQEVLLEEFYRSECWKIATRGPVGRIGVSVPSPGRTCTCVRRVSDCV
jgi:hypothetical protein